IRPLRCSMRPVWLRRSPLGGRKRCGIREARNRRNSPRPEHPLQRAIARGSDPRIVVVRIERFRGQLKIDWDGPAERAGPDSSRRNVLVALPESDVAGALAFAAAGDDAADASKA